MRARLLVVLVMSASVVPLIVRAQTHGNGVAPGYSFTPQAPPAPSGPVGGPSGPGFGPGRPSHPQPRSSAPPSLPLPVPFAGSVPDPIMRPAVPGNRRTTMPSDVFRAGRYTYAPRYGRWSAVSGGYTGGYGGYYDGGGYYGTPLTSQEPADLPQGRLALFVTPGSAQVYVDGFYTGTVADYQDRGLWLESGPHRVELRGDGYQTESFDVRIDADRPVDYRRDLTKSSSTRSDAPRVAANPKTFYVIPGCYAGDTPPEKDRLPSGCSAKNLRTIPPVVSRLTRR